MVSHDDRFNDYHSIRWREWLSDQDASQIDLAKSEKIFRFSSELDHPTLRCTLNFDDIIDRMSFLNTLLHDFKFAYCSSFLYRMIQNLKVLHVKGRFIDKFKQLSIDHDQDDKG